MADRLFMYSWYHGEIGRQSSESILMSQKPGLFLVRDSTTCRGGYVLSVSENRKVSHYIITNQNGQYQIGAQTFNDLPEIVDFYRRHFLDTTTLVEAAPRQSVNQPAPPQPQPQQELLKVKAKYNFPGNDPEDLAFRKNDVLTILRKEEQQWWMARDSMGKEGMIPANYVEPLPSRTSFSSANASSMRGRNSLNNATGGYTQPASAATSPPNLPMGTAAEVTVPAIAEAIQDRTPSIYDPLELKFLKGDKILVQKKNDAGTWEGKLKDGKAGIFPFRYVKIISNSPEDIAEFERSIND